MRRRIRDDTIAAVRVFCVLNDARDVKSSRKGRSPPAYSLSELDVAFVWKIAPDVWRDVSFLELFDELDDSDVSICLNASYKLKNIVQSG